MKTGKSVKNTKNYNVFTYNGNIYKYEDIYNLIKKLPYHKSGIDCDWTIIRVHDVKDNKDCYALFFQETSTPTDWKQDFKFFPQRVKAYKGWKNRLIYHKGFFEEYQSARDEIKSYLLPLLQDLAIEQDCEIKDLKLYICGWSLGACIAPIATEDIWESYGISPVIIGYEGANPCQSLHTRKVLMNAMHKDSIMFVYSNDITPRMPPFFPPLVFTRRIKNYIYYLNDHKCKFPFYFIKKIISFIRDTEFYHTHVDEGIKKFMPNE
jgi:hypothetical protein